MYGVTNHFITNFEALSEHTASHESLASYKWPLYLSKTAQNSKNWGGRGSTVVYKKGRVVRMDKEARIAPMEKKEFFDDHVKKLRNKFAQFKTILKITTPRGIVSE